MQTECDGRFLTASRENPALWRSASNSKIDGSIVNPCQNDLRFKFSQIPARIDMRKGKIIMKATVRRRNVPRYIMVVLMSTIGPKVKKVRMEPVVKVRAKDRARKASTVLHNDNTKAKPAMTKTELTGFVARTLMVSWGTSVCMSAARKAPTTRNRPISANSSLASFKACLMPGSKGARFVAMVIAGAPLEPPEMPGRA